LANGKLFSPLALLEIKNEEGVSGN